MSKAGAIAGGTVGGIVLLVLSVFGLVQYMRSTLCNADFIGEVDKEIWRVDFDSYDCPSVTSRQKSRCFTVSDTISMAASAKSPAVTNTIVNNVSYKGFGVVDMTRFDHSILTNVTFEGSYQSKNTKFVRSVVDAAVYEDQCRFENALLKKSLIFEGVFGGSTMISSATITNSLLGKLSFLESLVLSHPKISNSIVKDIEISGRGSLSGIKFSKSELYDMRVIGPSSFTDMKLSRSKIIDFAAGGELHFASAKVKDSEFSEILSVASISIARSAFSRTKIESVHGKDFCRLSDVTATKSELKKIKIDGSIKLDDVVFGKKSAVSMIEVGGSLMTRSMKLKDSTLTLMSVALASTLGQVKISGADISDVTFQAALEMTGGQITRSSIEKTLFNGPVKFAQLTLKKDSRLENVLFADEASFDHSHLTDSLLRSVVFLGPVSFQKATLKAIHFDNVVFAGRVDFSGSKLKNVLFSKCVFKDDVVFGDAATSDIKFPQTHFESEILCNEKSSIKDLNLKPNTKGPPSDLSPPLELLLAKSDLILSGDYVSEGSEFQVGPEDTLNEGEADEVEDDEDDEENEEDEEDGDYEDLTCNVDDDQCAA
eukprot:Plantae.Rhodophyta-Purpureofilum_apyrenoidigerum.ctg2207.p1 GENE.Plantae.Rhodophyta-Purpureofilum_apyrenoidigerum.ctg2207~~Plantae.Rhodophyta-Purpureofilum_apyrenoidigerum.ctg2207.p1  ORF type:complete len:704 (+),score=166.87 Plantae.Rhodophyta-Purpureofilum_apyrenoidigerum.ctg2207:317-2113(+)